MYLLNNYINKHVTFNKGQCIGHIEPSIDHMPKNLLLMSLTMAKDDKWTCSTWLFHTLPYIPSQVMWGNHSNHFQETFKSQFAQQHETSIATTHPTKMQIDTGALQNLSQHKPYPITMEALWQGKKWHKQTPWSTSNPQQPLQLVSTYHCSAQGRWWKMPSHWLQGLMNKVTWKFVWPMPRV